MNAKILRFFVVSLCALPLVLRGQVPFYDGFNYTAGKPLGTTGNGIWSKSVTAVSVVTGSLDGTGLGLAASSGNMVTVTGGTAGFSTDNTKGDFDDDDDITNAYFSFLLKLTDTDSIDTTGAGTPIINFNAAGSNTKTLVAVLLYNTGTHVEVGIAKYPGTASIVASRFVTSGAGSAIEDGSTYLVVGKLLTNPGNTNDTVSLWVNPTSLGNGEDPNPKVNAIGANTTDSGGGIGRVFVNSGYDASIDELRISTDWADVTPSSGGAPVATQLGFTALPIGAVAGTTLSPVVVQAEDAEGDPVADAGVSVAIYLSSGTGELTGTTNELTDSTGKATFSDLSINQAGMDQFTANASGLTGSTSTAFNVSATGSSTVTITSFTISGSTLTITGTGGTASGNYNVVTSTNLNQPVTNWTSAGSSQFDGSGNFNFMTSLSLAQPRLFYRIQTP